MDELYDSEEELFEAEAENILQLVGFFIGTEHFGVNILMVREIIRKPPLTLFPNAPSFIEGVINLRGDIIPVIDLRKRLNFPERAPEEERNIRILIVEIDAQLTGFIVDYVSGVIKIPKDTVEPPPDMVTANLDSQYISGVCKLEKKLLILLNFEKILNIKEIKRLKKNRIN